MQRRNRPAEARTGKKALNVIESDDPNSRQPTMQRAQQSRAILRGPCRSTRNPIKRDATLRQGAEKEYLNTELETLEDEAC